MYITIKDKENLDMQLSYRRHSIDDLFNNDNLEEVVLDDEDNEIENPTIRNKTYKIDRPTAKFKKTELDHVLRVCLDMHEIFRKHPEPESEYYTFKIPKKTHGFRTICAPEDKLKKDMARVAKWFPNRLGILTHDSAWAYVENRDVVKAVQEHTNNKSRWFLKIDLHDFFGSCNKDFIYKQLTKLYPFAEYIKDGYRGHELIRDTLKELAEFSTVNNGLPQGTPLSPILTNLLMVEFDYNMHGLIRELIKEEKLFKQKYIYTRYADDIIISARNKFDFKTLVNSIDKVLLKDTPLTLNKEKTRFGSNSGRNWNLGVMCNKENKTTVGHRQKHKLKTYFYQYTMSEELYPLDDLRYLLGQLSWLKNVEPDYFEGFINFYKRKYDIDLWNSIIEDIKKYNN